MWAQTRWPKACYMSSHQNLWKFRANSCTFVGKKQKFEIHLKGTGASKKPDKLRVEFFLNHIGDSWLEINSNYLPEHDDRGRGEAKLLARNPDNYATVLAKFEAYFKRGDVKPMLREKFRLHLRREAAETFDSWVVIVKEGPPNASFLSIFTSELWETNSPFFARRTVINWNFMTREPPFHLKILWRSCFWEELRNVSCKSQRRQSLRVSHSEIPSKTPRGDHSSQAARNVDIAITSTPLDGRIHQRRTPDATSATNWGIFP